MVSSQPLRAFNAALSPDQLSGRWTGAGGGNRNRVFGVALRGLTFQLRPHGGKRKESNLLPQRDCVYSAATAPAVLIGASRNWRRAEGSNLGPCGPLGFRDRLPATPAALSRRARRARGWCISQDSNLDPVPYEGTALPIELEMRELALRREIESLSPRRQRSRLTRSVTEQWGLVSRSALA